jgi:hypothetical protein
LCARSLLTARNSLQRRRNAVSAAKSRSKLKLPNAADALMQEQGLRLNRWNCPKIEISIQERVDSFLLEHTAHVN